MSDLIGREKEISQLESYIKTKQSEFIAIYGRRRVGKTFMITETFKDRLLFDMSGIIDGNKEDQLTSFTISLNRAGLECKIPHNWYEAFENLKKLIEKSRKGKKIIFIDELPCLDTPRAGLVKALDLFWNGWANRRKDIKLIVCGSATTWMVDNIINNHGGLHNRITHEMHVHPFSLYETEKFLISKGFKWTKMMIAQAYMAVGGIPYYLSLFENKQSLSENLDRLFFSADGELRKEYDRVFQSLFRNPQPYTDIINLLTTAKKGLTRTEIATKLSKDTGGHLTKLLTNLENCDFIRKYNVKDKKINSNNGIYQLTDFYTIFYHSFCMKRKSDPNFWSNALNTPSQNTWYGLAFERLCMAHIPQIKSKIGIDKISTEYFSWRSKTSPKGAQIDLIIERADNITNVCEIKYSSGIYALTSSEMDKMRVRISDYVTETNCRNGIHPTFITTCGLKDNEYASEFVQVITLDDLFKIL